MIGVRGIAIAAAAAAAAGIGALAGSPGAGPATTSPEGAPVVLYASVPVGAAAASGRVPAGSRIEANPLDRSAPPRNLTDGFAAAGSPSPVHDGRSFLFAGRRADGDRDAIFEMAADGSGVRERVAFPGADAATPAALPDGGVVFAAALPGGGRALFVAPPGGEAPRRVTFHAAGEDGDPAVLHDGRILFRHARGGRSDLLAVHPDGTGIHPFHGSGLPAAERRRPREAEDRSVWFVEGERAARIDARRPARPAVPLALEGTVAAVEPLDAGGLLLSHAAAAGRPTLGLRVLRPGGPPGGEILVDDPDRDETDPVLLAPRRRPQGQISLVDPAKDRGSVVCIDARRRPRPEPGSPPAAAVRFSDPERVLGEVRLAADGSLWADLPPDRPIRVETLAADGAVLAGSGFDFWVRPGENRICLGCHEDPAVAPPNVFPAAVLGGPVELAHPAGGAR